MRSIGVIFVLILISTLVVTALLYPKLPDSVPIHWDTEGHVDNYAPKRTMLIVNPAIMASVTVLFFLLPWLSPRRFEVDAVWPAYVYVMLLLFGTFAYFQAVLLWVGLSGRIIDPGRAIVGGICLMIALLGTAVGRIHRNFYIGIRTPWAIANEEVWIATHRLTAKLFVIAGITGLVLFGLGVRNSFLLFPFLAAVLVAVVYSFVFYKRLEHQGRV